MMLPQDFNFADRLLDLRVEEEQRRASARRLEIEAAGGHLSWLPRLRHSLLSGVGRFLVTHGQRLQKSPQRQTLSSMGSPDSGV